MALDSVIRRADNASIPSANQINSINLDQSIRLLVTTDSPLIMALFNSQLAYADGFESLLKEDYRGDVVNAAEGNPEIEKKYKIMEEQTALMNSFVRVSRDVTTRPRLIVDATSGTNSGTSQKNLVVTELGDYHGLAGTTLYNPRTREAMIVDFNATSNTITVTRGANSTTAAATVANDVLLICGQHVGLDSVQTVSRRNVPKRRSPVLNGFYRLISEGMPISSTLDENTLLYNGQFLDYVSEDLVKSHREAILNTVLYYETGTIDEQKDPIGQFNGWRWFARQNSLFDNLQDMGPLTSVNFKALMTWFEPYQVGTSTNSPMIYFCGNTAYQALQQFLKTKTFVQSVDHVPSTVGGVVNKVITDNGKVIYICLDTYLTSIGRGGDIFMTAENNMTLLVGKDKFFTPEVSASQLGILPGAARFCQYIQDYYALRNQRSDAIISQFSLQVGYSELVMCASGITAAIV